MQVDYIIVGQGLCGTFLSYELLKAGKKVLVIDNSSKNSATKVASGIINPITGRRVVRSWMIEELLPAAAESYKSIGALLQASFIQPMPILDFHTSPQMQLAFEERMESEKDYLHTLQNTDEWRTYFNFPFGITQISPAYSIHLNNLLYSWRTYLQTHESLSTIKFEEHQLQLLNEGIQYENIIAEKIIFCDGIIGMNNSFFKQLPFAPSKGEALIVSIPDLPTNFLYKSNLTIAPWQDGLFWIGSTHEWTFENDKPTEAFRNKAENFLTNFLKLPYTIVDHLAAIRPSNLERRPFVGLHPLYPQIGILNGMGTKGCTLAPYFAHQLTEFLISNKPINPAADIRRFTKILSK